MTNREQFEAWWKSEEHDLHHNPHSPFKRFAWDAWQASREVIEIEVPSSEHEEGSDYWFDDTFQPLRYERDIEREIERHGLKVKS